MFKYMFNIIVVIIASGHLTFYVTNTSKHKFNRI